MPGNLVLVTSSRESTVEATASTATQASEQVLAKLVEHFDLHYSFLRYSDHDIRPRCVWPRNGRRDPDVADPDPFAVVPFTSADPALALCDNGKERLVMVQRRLRRRCT